MPRFNIIFDTDTELNQLIADNIVTAFEGGCNYWLHGAKIKGIDTPTRLWYSEPETYKPGFVMILKYDNPNAEGVIEKEVSYEDLIKGLEIMNEKFSVAYSDFVQETGDATTADIFLQCTLFGELIFG